MSKTQQIALVGTGNVAFHLTRFFLDKGLNLTTVYGRNQQALEEFHALYNIEISTDFSRIPKDTLVLVCVADSAIHEVINQLPTQLKIAYTSGSTSLNALPSERTLGVFYPLQTFSKGLALQPEDIPFFIEANNPTFEKELMKLAQSISSNVNKATSEDRYHLHLAAVMSNNFVNHLFHLSENYLIQHNLSFKHLQPLIYETIRKIKTESPEKMQTGPAKRGDTLIIHKHLASLDGLERELYALFTRSIQQLNTTNEDEL